MKTLKIKTLCLDVAVCSSWGRRLPKHIFKTQFASKRGHRYCLNCGLTIQEVRDEEKFNREGGTIENRVIEFFSDLDKPTYLTTEDLRKHNYKVPI